MPPLYPTCPLSPSPAVAGTTSTASAWWRCPPSPPPSSWCQTRSSCPSCWCVPDQAVSSAEFLAVCTEKIDCGQRSHAPSNPRISSFRFPASPPPPPAGRRLPGEAVVGLPLGRRRGLALARVPQRDAPFLLGGVVAPRDAQLHRRPRGLPVPEGRRARARGQGGEHTRRLAGTTREGAVKFPMASSGRVPPPPAAHHNISRTPSVSPDRTLPYPPAAAALLLPAHHV